MCAIICNKSLSFRQTRHHSPHEFVEKRHREIDDAPARAVNHALLEQRGAQLQKTRRTFDILQVRVLTKSACSPHKQRILQTSKNCAGSGQHLTLPTSDNCARRVPAGVSGNGKGDSSTRFSDQAPGHRSFSGRNPSSMRQFTTADRRMRFSKQSV